MDEVTDASYAQRPDTLKHLRACRSCKLIKTLEQFTESFCENCWKDWADGQMPGGLRRGMRNDTAIERTTTDFEGCVAMMRPDDSWVSRWLQMKKSDEDGKVTSFKPGLYAIALPGEPVGGAGVEGYEEGYDDEEDAEEREQKAGAGSKGAAADEDDEEDS